MTTATITTGTSSSAALKPSNGSRILIASLAIPMLLITFARRKFLHRAILPVLLLSCVTTLITACGGSTPLTTATPAGPTSPAITTPTGSYTVTLVATGTNGLSQSSSITLTVR